MWFLRGRTEGSFAWPNAASGGVQLGLGHVKDVRRVALNVGRGPEDERRMVREALARNDCESSFDAAKA